MNWSLAVEEQFYVVFPILLVALYKLYDRAVVPVLALLTAASFAAAMIWGASSPTATFFLIQFRAWELLIGALAALWVMRNGSNAHNGIAGLGVAATLLSFFLVSEETLWPGPLTMLPVLGSAAVLLFASGDTFVARALSWAPIRFIGLISYSLSLWHLPLLVFLNIYHFGEPPHYQVAIAVILSGLCAWLSWRFVERPFRTAGAVQIKPFMVMLATSAALLLVFSIPSVQTGGFQQFQTSRIPTEFAARVIDREAEVLARAPIWKSVMSTATDPFPDTPQRKVLILGDSLSGDLMVATQGHREFFPRTVFRRQRLDDPCMPMLTGYLENETLIKVGSDKCSKEVSKLIESPLFAEAEEIILANNWQPETASGGLELARALITITKRDVSILSVAAFNDMASLSMQLHRIDEPIEVFFNKNIRAKFLPLNAMFAQVAAETPALRYLDKLALYCDPEAGTCDMLDPRGKPIIFDSAHVTVPGVAIMADRIRSAGWFK